MGQACGYQAGAQVDAWGVLHRCDQGEQMVIALAERTQVDTAVARQPLPQPGLSFLLRTGLDSHAAQQHQGGAVAVTDDQPVRAGDLKDLGRVNRSRP